MGYIIRQDETTQINNVFNWDPWVGCRYTSTGCTNCPYCKSKQPAKFNKTQFYLPTRQTRKYDISLGKNTMQYKITSGSTIIVCSRSDFFISDANYYRKRAWKLIQERKDILFSVTTKHLENFYINLPFAYTFDNIIVFSSVEDQYTADKRIRQLLELPIKHRGIEIAPLLSGINIEKYLSTGLIDEVTVSGETQFKSGYHSLSKCEFNQVKEIARQCKIYDVKFSFKSTGTLLFKDNTNSYIQDIREQQKLAEFLSIENNLNNNGKSFEWQTSLEDLETMERIEQAHKIFKLTEQKYRLQGDNNEELENLHHF